jgi:hypothetical protein
MLSESTQAAVRRVSESTMGVRRFVIQTASTARGTTGDRQVYTDDLEAFDARLKILQAKEIPAQFTNSKSQIYRLVAQAGISLNVDDRVKDQETGYVYEVLGDDGPGYVGPLISQFIVGRAH